MRKRLDTGRVYLLITGIVTQAALLLPWIPANGRMFSTPAYLVRMFSAEDMERLILADFGMQGSSWQEVSPMALVFLIQMIMLVLVQIAGLLNIFAVLFARKDSDFFDKTNLALGSAGLLLCTFNVLCIRESLVYLLHELVTNLYLLVILILHTVSFLGFRLIDSWAAATAEYIKLRRRDRELKKERKRRLAFEGRYSQLFYVMIRKNFKSNWESYRLLILGGTVSVSFIFSAICMRRMLSGAGGPENLTMGQGLGVILMNFLAAAAAISVFLIVSILLFYLKHHVKNYALFINLGIRSRTLYLFAGFELLGCILLSLFGGTILGNVILAIARTVIRRSFGDAAVFESITGKTYLLAFIVTFFVYLVSAMAAHDIYYDTGSSGSRYKEVMKEKTPGRASPLIMLLGAGIMALAVISFADRKGGESVKILAVFFFGMFLFLRNAWHLYLKKRKKKARVYFGDLLKKNYFYHHFKTAFRYMFLFTLLHVSVLFVFSKELISSGIAADAEKMFPYDYVCMATDEDRALFEEMEREHHAEVMTYPMVRVTNVDNSSRWDDIRQCIQPQGQNIGISETTYKLLCGAAGVKPREFKLAGDGSDVYLVFQEDESAKAHPLDYFTGQKNPYLYVGQPLPSYNFVIREEIFIPREVKGEERRSLVGNLSQGEHENIVVFSDGYFAAVQEKWKTTDYITGTEITEEEAIEGETIHHWPDRLVFLNVEEKEKGAVEELLGTFRENHWFDEQFDSAVQSCYSKDELLSRRKSERFMNMFVSSFIMVIILTVILVLFYIKAESEMEEKKRRQEFLECMGMRKKERLRLIKAETAYFFGIPFMLGTVIAAVFTVILWKLRLYTGAKCISYMKALAVIYAVYTGIQLLALSGLERYVMHKVEN